MRLDDGTAIDADLVVVGIGVEPATGWLENTGLDVTNGVLCDVALLAVGGGGDIAAAGDLARWPYPRYGDEPLRVEHWVNGVESAQHAARTLVHGVQAAGAYEPDLYFWTEQHGVHLQSVGQPGRGDEVVVQGSLEERSFAAVVVGIEARLLETREAGHAERLAAAATDLGHDRVIAVGGDSDDPGGDQRSARLGVGTDGGPPASASR